MERAYNQLKKEAKESWKKFRKEMDADSLDDFQIMMSIIIYIISFILLKELFSSVGAYEHTVIIALEAIVPVLPFYLISGLSRERKIWKQFLDKNPQFKEASDEIS
jgi:hypothetical protein